MDLLSQYGEVNETNRELIFSQIEDLLYLYLYEGKVSPSNSTIGDLFGLTESELNTLKTAHFLFSKEVGDFISSLPKLMRNLSHSTKKENNVIRGNILGKIEWDKTLKERYSLGFDDKSLFVCSPPLKYYDLEENQLLKFILKKIIELTKNNLKIIKDNEKIDFDKLDIDGNWQDLIHYRSYISKKILNKVYFNEIQDITPKSKHVRKCFRNRNKLYYNVAKVYKLYKKLFSNDEEVIIDLIGRYVVKTMDVHTLYELYVFFNLVRKLNKNKQVKLMHYGNKNSISCSKDGFEIFIHYRNTPDIFSKKSMYKKIIYNYDGPTVNVRAPDIIIEFRQGNQSFYRIVEVKNSSDDDYIRKSIYKVMGYYQDFKPINESKNHRLCNKYPVVLITYGGISLKEEYDPFSDEIIILNREEFLNSLENLLSFN